MKKLLAILVMIILGYVSLVLIIIIPKFAEESNGIKDYVALTIMGVILILGIYSIKLIWKKAIKSIKT